MDEFNADRLSATLDLFLLKRLSHDGPLSALEMQRRAKPIHALLDLFAVRRGKQGLGTVSSALQRLHGEGWLKVEPKSDHAEQSEVVYSLTAIGEQRAMQESARLDAILSQFVDEGDMERSFGKFLRLRRQGGEN